MSKKKEGESAAGEKEILQPEKLDLRSSDIAGEKRVDVGKERYGFPLTTAVETLKISGETVFGLAGGEMRVCLEQGLTLELIREIATRPVGRVVCLDEGFAGNDQLKTNAVQIFKTKGIVFKTV